MKDSIDVLISMDTTGSMYPCLTQVRRNVVDLTKRLFKNVPELRMGIITHGDYCDGDKVMTNLDFSNNESRITKFVNSAPATGGGDEDECYELVLKTARTMDWKSGNNKVLVLIGDCNPHKVGYSYGGIKNNLDWENEAKLLNEAGIEIYPVQCLARYQSNEFYDSLGEFNKNKIKLDLNQFSHMADTIEAIIWQRAGKLKDYEGLTSTKTKISDIWFKQIVDRLAGRKAPKTKKEKGLTEVNPARFQILSVDEDTPIKDFVQENGLLFKTGRGFYEFEKKETIQEKKEVVLQDKSTGVFYTGPLARNMIGVPFGTRARLSPVHLDKYRVFVQSTSPNRKLMEGSTFLYEVDFSR